jgi:uncharacterized protein
LKGSLETVSLSHVYVWLRRRNDGHDPDHGLRAADYARAHRGFLPELEDDAFELLVTALAEHVDG